MVGTFKQHEVSNNGDDKTPIIIAFFGGETDDETLDFEGSYFKAKPYDLDITGNLGKLSWPLPEASFPAFSLGWSHVFFDWFCSSSCLTLTLFILC